MATAERIAYVDASALVKLVMPEPQSRALASWLAPRRLMSCELVLTEVLRAIAQAVGTMADPRLTRATDLLEGLPLVALDGSVLRSAGALPEPRLRSLDAVHVAVALGVAGLEAFVTYDVRQAAAARLVGLDVVSPGA